MMRFDRRSWLPAVLALALAADAQAADLRGSRTSMQRQNQVAKAADLSFLRTPGDVQRLVVQGTLEPVWGGADYELANVSHPYAQPEVRLFVERLAADYRRATGQPLVVTSLTRPSARQPRNAHDLSVHPAGMAVDLRVPAGAADRQWLEDALLALEREGVLDVTRERRPPHYHIAVFPAEYRAYEDRLAAAAALTRATRAALERPAPRLGGVAAGNAAAAGGDAAAGVPGAGAFLLLLGALGAAGAAVLGGLRRRTPQRLRILP